MVVRLRFGFILFLAAAAEEPVPHRRGREEATYFLQHVSDSAGVALAGQDAATTPSPADELAQLREEVKRYKREATIAELAAKRAIKNATAEASENVELKSAVKKLEAEKANFSQVKESLQKELAESRKSEHTAEAEAKADKEKYIIEARHGYMGPLGSWMAVFPHQGIVATAGLAVGLISVVGPNTLLDCWFALIGCVLGGLMFGSAIAFWIIRGSTPWVDVMSGMVHLSMEFWFGYPVWIVWTILGFIRYWTGCKCQLYASVPQIKVDTNSGRVSTPAGPITTPLLNPSSVSRPPRPPSQPTPPPSTAPAHDGPVRPSGETTPRRPASPASSGQMPRVSPTPSNSSRPSGRRPDMPKPAPSKSTGMLSQGMQKVASLGSKNNPQGHQ